MAVWLKFAALAMVTATATVTWIPPTDAVPAHYAVSPRRGYPPLLSGEQLNGPLFNHPYKVMAYEMAAKVESVLFQQPCYCRCDRALGHKSLHSCFEGTHGAVCATCMRQAVYAYQQTQHGKTPKEIRAGIDRGDWQQVDVENATL